MIEIIINTLFNIFCVYFIFNDTCESKIISNITRVFLICALIKSIPSSDILCVGLTAMVTVYFICIKLIDIIYR
jgi:hypothetical protein